MEEGQQGEPQREDEILSGSDSEPIPNEVDASSASNNLKKRPYNNHRRPESRHHKKEKSMTAVLNSDAPFAGSTRSLYLGNLPPQASVRDICDVLRGGNGIEAVRILPEKSCGFVDFLEVEGAQSFVDRWKRNRLRIAGEEFRVGWAKPTPMQEKVEQAVKNGATRNIYLNGITCDGQGEKSADEMREYLFAVFDEFGAVDMIKVVPDLKIAFVHMASIADAIKAVAVLAGDPQWKGKRISFGRDRCGEKIEEKKRTENLTDEKKESKDSQLTGPRTVYLGGCPKDISMEDLCNVIRTGMLQSVRVNGEKKCAFVTFISPDSAAAFLNFVNNHGLAVRGSALKAGWAKETNDKNKRDPNQLPLSIVTALQRGATRNLYLGNISLQLYPEETLRRDFTRRFGPIESLNTLKEKQVIFVNFGNLLDAVKAHDELRRDVHFENCKIGFGKDRCAGSSNASVASGLSMSGSTGSINTGNHDQLMTNMNNLYFGHYPQQQHPQVPYYNPMMPYYPNYYNAPTTQSITTTSSTASYPPYPYLPPHQQPPLQQQYVLEMSTSLDELYHPEAENEVGTEADSQNELGNDSTDNTTNNNNNVE